MNLASFIFIQDIIFQKFPDNANSCAICNDLAAFRSQLNLDEFMNHPYLVL